MEFEQWYENKVTKTKCPTRSVPIQNTGTRTRVKTITFRR